MTLAERITRAVDDATLATAALRDLFFELRDALERGEVRAAECVDGQWQACSWVKQGILLGFRVGLLTGCGHEADASFFDKDTMAARQFVLEDGVRVVPGGSSVRRGAHIGAGVVIMPPAFVNIGAYVDRDTMIDSHALVGSCAQVGQRVHLSAAAQLGGVLEPTGAVPVVVEDDVMVGGNCGVYEGVIVRQGAVLGSGTILNGSTVVYDLVQQRELRARPGQPLEIPSRAVVVPGTRPLRGAFALELGLSIAAPLIIKYRDARTDARTALEQALRQGAMGTTP
ncbi:MAG: 2,3,4,5-tetrahydropyridine-2,6-dicarboxylate N-succinyltransferase [Pseudomonadota bacterium]